MCVMWKCICRMRSTPACLFLSSAYILNYDLLMAFDRMRKFYIFLTFLSHIISQFAIAFRFLFFFSFFCCCCCLLFRSLIDKNRPKRTQKTKTRINDSMFQMLRNYAQHNDRRRRKQMKENMMLRWSRIKSHANFEWTRATFRVSCIIIIFCFASSSTS